MNKPSRLCAMLLCAAMLLSLLPATALAGEGDATIQYLNTEEGIYQETSEGAGGVLISGGSNPYTLPASWSGLIVVNNANVSYTGESTDWYVFGSGSLNLGSVTLRAGSYTTPYEGADGPALLSFIGGIPENTTYSYTVTGSYEVTQPLDAYDVTVSVGGALTIKAPANAEEGQHNRLCVKHALTVAENGSLTADADQPLEIDENVTVTGLQLYNDDASTVCNTPAGHSFIYDNSKWVCTEGGGEPQDPGQGQGGGEPQDPGQGQGGGEPQDPGQGQGGGTPQDPGQGQGGGANPDPAAAKEKIEGRRWAHYNTNTQARFLEELWDMVAHEYYGLFADKDALSAAVSYGELATDDTMPAGLQSYYPFTVELGENDASGRVYVLAAQNSFVVRTTKEGTNDTYTLVTSGDVTEGLAAVTADYDRVQVFGNGVMFMGDFGHSDYHLSGHVTHFEDWTYSKEINCRLGVFKPDFRGVKAVAAGESNYAAAWGFAQSTYVGTNAAAECEVFFGNTSVTLSKPEIDAIAVTGISDVTTTLPSGAVSIESAGDGAAKTFTVTFQSNFYDEIPLTITYTTSDGTATGALKLRRVGIEIVGYRQTGEGGADLRLNHGTDPGPTVTNRWTGDVTHAVYATFYYPAAYAGTVELFVTYTWSDATVTRRHITQPAAHSNAGEVGQSVAADDFELYAGGSAYPVKIEVTAIKAGSSGETFAGAALGAGAGVAWNASCDYSES